VAGRADPMPDELIPVHPTEPVTTPAGTVVDIDVEMIPVVRILWRLGLSTVGCCHDLGESLAGGGHRTSRNDHDRSRHLAFYAGVAWLKMPQDAAARLVTILADDETFGPRMTDWTHPDAWLSYAPLAPDKNGAVLLADKVQLHFPRRQLPELARVLAAIID